MNEFKIILRAKDANTLTAYLNSIRATYKMESELCKKRGWLLVYDEEIKDDGKTAVFRVSGTPTYIKEKYEATINNYNNRKNRLLLKLQRVQIEVKK